MKRKLLWAAAFCTLVLGAQEFRNDGLKTADPGAYFSPLGGAAFANGTLTLPAGALHQVATLPFPAKGGERYRLTFLAQIQGPHVIEENPQYERLFFFSPWTRKRLGQPLAAWEIVFRDRKRQIVTPAKTFLQFFNVVMSSRKRGYCEEFHTPAGTASIEVVFRNANKEDALLIEDLKFTRIESAPTLNINPDFSLGKDNYSGWNGADKARIVPSPDAPGKFLLNAANTGVIGDGIPVKAGDSIRLEYRMKKSEDAKGNARMQIFTYKDNLLRADCRTGQLARTFFFGPRMTEGNYSFVVPEGITLLRPYLENVTAEYLRFVRDVGDGNSKAVEVRK